MHECSLSLAGIFEVSYNCSALVQSLEPAVVQALVVRSDVWLQCWGNVITFSKSGAEA